MISSAVRSASPPQAEVLPVGGVALRHFANAFRGRRVLVTGDTGFKGSWLAIWLRELGADVIGYGLPPATAPSNFALASLGERIDHVDGDIRDGSTLRGCLARHRPEFIFHLAAQALVRGSYAQPRETFEVNTIGTCALLDAVRETRLSCAIVVVTSDKCYQNREWPHGYREPDPLGGHDPYSASKGCQELVVGAYRSSFFPPALASGHGVCLATARAGNVIGGGDWAADRLVPDFVRACSSGEPLGVRSPGAVRPWQHVLEPLSGYLWLAARMRSEGGERFAKAWNFGPAAAGNCTVRMLLELLMDEFGDGAWIEQRRPDDPAEAVTLRLSCDQANHELGWYPTYDLGRAVQATGSWYRDVVGDDVRDVDVYARCVADIGNYCKAATAHQAIWISA